jgi:hypothetical protein
VIDRVAAPSISTVVRTSQLVLVLWLVVLWWLDTLHRPVSDYVGTYFPVLPRLSPLAWPSLVTEAVVIEALMCVPAAVVLVLAFRSEATAVAIGLASVFALGWMVEILDRDFARGWPVLGFLHFAAHAGFLIGGVLCVKRLTARSGRHSLRDRDRPVGTNAA